MPYRKGTHLAVKVGDVYGKLTVEAFEGGFGEDKSWRCRCECGRKVVARQHYLRRPNKHHSCKSCRAKKPAWNQIQVAIGEQFGALTVEECLGHKDEWGGTKYRCKCTCGRYRELTAYMLSKKPKLLFNCGKYPCRGRAWNNQSVGDITGLFWAHLKNSAKARHHKVLISKEQAWNKLVVQNYRCALSGVPIELSTDYRNPKHTASIDRKDSNGDYTEENIQWVHKTVNKMKNALPEYEFREWCSLIHKHGECLNAA